MIKSVLAAAALSAALAAGSVAAAQTAPAQTAPAHAHESARPTIESAIKELLANADTAAVLEKHLPGLSAHPALPQFQDMTLAEVAPYSQGAVTAAIITAIDTDLKALPAPATHAH